MTKLLEEMIEAAEAAGAVIRDLYDTLDTRSRTKDDGSPVTEADMASERLLRSRLAAIEPIPILSEERKVSYEERASWKRFWLVDPLDGTRDYLGRTDDFAVCIALVDEGRPQVGVVHAPVHRTTWASSRDGPVLRVRDGARTVLPKPQPADPPKVALVSRFHRAGGGTDAYLQRLGVEDVEHVGSAIKFARMAEGLADTYVRLGPTMEWDVGAGECLVVASGLEVVSVPEGVEFAYNKEDLRNPSFIVRSPSSTRPLPAD